jgi:hypothetical protein
MSKDDSAYDVGYKKPPRSGQFVKGQSGNLKGRPKGSRNLASIVLQESRQKVRVNGPRGARTITKAEAGLMQLSNMAAQGNLRAVHQFTSLIQWSEETTAPKAPEHAQQEKDSQVMQMLLQRMREAKTTKPTDTQERSDERTDKS